MTRLRDDENRALKGAYRKGREAYADGKPIERCPYPDWTTARGSVTFSRAFRRYWFEGWEDARAEDVELCRRMNGRDR
jgi:ribosome modulation factor